MTRVPEHIRDFPVEAAIALTGVVFVAQTVWNALGDAASASQELERIANEPTRPAGYTEPDNTLDLQDSLLRDALSQRPRR